MYTTTTTDTRAKVDFNLEMISLFDYLGKPAGGELGKEVYAEARKRRIKVESREVESKGYTGKIMMYPKSFLNEYFNKSTTVIKTRPEPADDGLPF